MTLILAIDQGTTSSRAILFDDKLQVVASAQEEFPQHFPQSGWVEHDPLDLWSTTAATCRAVVEKAGVGADDIASRIAVMDEGNLVQVATPAEIYEAPNSVYVADFIGDVNIIEGRATQPGTKTGIAWAEGQPPILATPAKSVEAGQSVHFAIRPEKVTIDVEKPDRPNTFRGKVIDIAYLGNISTYHVELAGGQMIKAQMVNARRLANRPITWEDEVWVGFTDVQIDSGVTGDGLQMRRGVGRAADGAVDDDRVLKGLAGQDVGGFEILVDHFHDALAGLVGHRHALAERRGNGRVAGERHAERLGHGVHRRGGAHGVAMPQRRRRGADPRHELFVVDLTLGQQPARFPDDGAGAGALALPPAVEHRAAVKGNRRVRFSSGVPRRP